MHGRAVTIGAEHQRSPADTASPPISTGQIVNATGVPGTFCVRDADKNRADQGKANAGEALFGACPQRFESTR